MKSTLWLMRHGLAVDQFDSDFSRELSEHGAEQVRDVCQQILKAKDLPTEVLSSPFERTQATAEIAKQVLDIPSAIQTEEMLVHFADHQVVGEYLKVTEFEKLLVVTHMPIIARLAHYLDADCAVSSFSTAQVARFDKTDKGTFEFRATYQPNRL